MYTSVTNMLPRPSLCDDLSCEDHDNVPINKKSEVLVEPHYDIVGELPEQDGGEI